MTLWPWIKKEKGGIYKEVGSKMVKGGKIKNWKGRWEGEVKREGMAEEGGLRNI